MKVKIFGNTTTDEVNKWIEEQRMNFNFCIKEIQSSSFANEFEIGVSIVIIYTE